jgi:hypothetical protein
VESLKKEIRGIRNTKQITRENDFKKMPAAFQVTKNKKKYFRHNSGY